MALEAIAAVQKAEANAAKCKTDALQSAKQLLARTETEGAAAMETALRRAADELCKSAREADEKAGAQVENIRKAAEDEIAALRRQSESRLAQAADHIVERIVNG